MKTESTRLWHRTRRVRASNPPRSGLRGCASLLPLLMLLITCATSEAQSPTLLDWGDAPAPYPTLQNGGGARHQIVSGFTLGASVDAESGGQPSANADADDLNPSGADDENGVTFPTLAPGQTTTVTVVVRDASTTALSSRVDIFIDFNRNGSWLDAGERFSFPVTTPGTKNFSVAVPSTAQVGTTYARVRLSRAGTDLPTGSSPNGEVEDYRVTIAEMDFGDAPDYRPAAAMGYPTWLSSNGARHRIVSGIHLGSRVDREPDGQPGLDATGDDLNPTTADDEDGVVFLTDLIAGQPAAIQVTASVAGCLDGWIDFDQSLSWESPPSPEKILSSRPIVAGVNQLVILVPPTAVKGSTYARFRFSLLGDLHVTGEATNGEVEDYKVTIREPQFDFGDAPESPTASVTISGYPTRESSGGARHLVFPGFHLGEKVDGEADGQPNADATGDDVLQPDPEDGFDDEDGVQFLSALIPGQTAHVTVYATAEGKLDAWIDFNGNRAWATGEKIFSSQALNVGANPLTFLVPQSASPRITFARFRFSVSGVLEPTGDGGPGEVEDYQVTVAGRPDPGCEGGCGGSDFWLTFPGNYAPDPDNPAEQTLLIVGAPGTTGKMSLPAIDPGDEVTFTIGASGSTKFIIAKNDLLGDANDLAPDNGIRNFGVHVTTDAGALVNVYGLSRVRQTSDGFLALPTEALGTGYFIQSYANVQTGVPSLNGSQFAIVATAPGATLVVITPSSVTGAHDSGVPYSITLTQGQTYQLRNTYGAPSDLSGTFVHSDKPIAVFSGHRCANVQSVDAFYCDYLVEQLLPIKRWGT